MTIWGTVSLALLVSALTVSPSAAAEPKPVLVVDDSTERAVSAFVPSAIAFWQPSSWQHYQWSIVGALSIGLLHVALIAQLGVALAKRRRVERALRESDVRSRIVTNSAPVMMRMSEVDKHRAHRRFRRHDGEYRWISDSGVPRYDSQGNIAAYIGSCLDTTERLRVEERFRQVFEAAPNAMIIVSEKGRIALVNAQVEKLFGYRRHELVGRPMEILIPERLRTEHPRHRENYTGDPQARAMGVGRGVFARRKNGSEVPVEISLNTIRTVEGRFVIASVIDITERQQAEAESQELRRELAHMSRIATMGELTAAIVHELGQPLAGIAANAQAGLRLIATGALEPHEAREILSDIVSDEQRARQVIQHLRTMFLKGEVEHRPLQLNDLIHDVAAVVLQDGQRRRISIVFDLASGSLCVSADRVQLQQVVLNLVVNAFDALADVTDRPRKVILRTRRLDGGLVQVDVADNGPGITADKVASIFKPFVTTKAKGMGMGLSVSHSIVTAHHGRLWAENGSERGATFHVVLPAIAVAEA